MAIPSLPWYGKLEKAIAPTEGASEFLLILLIIITLFVLWKGSPVVKAAWAIYLVSP